MKYTIGSNLMRLLLTGAIIYLATSISVTAGTEKSWDFRVFLDDKEIGFHKVSLSSKADEISVLVDARFDVRFLFFNAYHYEHTTEETWKGTCLTNLSSDTDDNGKKLFIRAQPASNGVQLETHEGQRKIEGCVRSFAYWDPELLSAKRLLNTQTGEYQPVTIDFLGESPIEIDEVKYEAFKYRLMVENKYIDLWYTPEMDWLALQTTVRGGRQLSYFPAKRVL